MKKKILLIFGFFLIALAFSGCGKNSNDTNGTISKSSYEKVQKMLIDLKTYQSDAAVTYISNKNTNEYETYQQCRITGEYKIEVTGPEKVSGNVTLFDGKTIAQFNPKISGKISVGTTEASERSEIFITSFIRNYIKSDEVSLSVANLEEGQCTVLEANVPGDHPYLSSEKLWIDNKTLKPVKLIIYDLEGAERIVVSYSNFEYNVTLDDTVFKLDQ